MNWFKKQKAEDTWIPVTPAEVELAARKYLVDTVPELNDLRFKLKDVRETVNCEDVARSSEPLVTYELRQAQVRLNRLLSARKKAVMMLESPSFYVEEYNDRRERP